jgi:hypothetical protein
MLTKSLYKQYLAGAIDVLAVLKSSTKAAIPLMLGRFQKRCGLDLGHHPSFLDGPFAVFFFKDV